MGKTALASTRGAAEYVSKIVTVELSGTVLASGQDANLQQLAGGYAWHYKVTRTNSVHLTARVYAAT
jgi:hypothetical protein